MFNYSISYLFNISILLAIKGHIIESLLILRKLNRYAPNNTFIKHNMVIIMLLDNWFYDVVNIKFSKEQENEPNMKLMLNFATEKLKV